MKTHLFIPFMYEKIYDGDENRIDAIMYENVKFLEDFGSIKKNSEWALIEVRIDGESPPHIYCRQCDEEEDGEVIFVDFEILKVNPIKSYSFEKGQF